MFGLVDAPEIYTSSIGLFFLWVFIKISIIFLQFTSNEISTQFKTWIFLLIKCAIAGSLLFILIPLILGHLVELFFLIPLRVPHNKIPVFYFTTVS